MCFFLLQHIVNFAIDFFQRFNWILIVDCGVWNHGPIGHLCNAKSSSWVIFFKIEDSRFELHWIFLMNNCFFLICKGRK
jgi:hypothetical protein